MVGTRPVGVDEVGVVRGEQVGDSGGGVNDHHLFGYSRGEQERRAVFDRAEAPEGGGEFDGSAVVDGVLTDRGRGDEDHAVHRVHIHPTTGVPAELAQQNPLMHTT